MTQKERDEYMKIVLEVLETISQNENGSFEELALKVTEMKKQYDLWDSDKKMGYVNKIMSFVNKNNGRVSMSDLQLESDISFKVIGNLQATICELSDVVFINIDKSLYDEYDNFEQIGTWVNYADLPLDTLKELWEVLEK